MKRLQKAFISFGIVAILVAGSSSVFARTQATNKERAVSGSIVQIDRTARTITIRTHATGETVQVRVPEGSLLRTNQTGLSAASFEQLIPGMFVRDVRAQ